MKKMNALGLLTMSLFLSFSLMVCIGTIPITSEASEGPLDPEVAIQLEHSEMTYDSSHDDVIHINGSIEVSALPFQKVSITLSAYFEDWPISIAPSILECSGSDSQLFMITILPPPIVDKSFENTIQVSGSWSATPGALSGEIEPSSCKITVIAPTNTSSPKTKTTDNVLPFLDGSEVLLIILMLSVILAIKNHRLIPSKFPSKHKRRDRDN